MTFKLICSEYGFECDFEIQGSKSLSMVKKLRDHFENEHGIDYSVDFIIQMLVNKGHTRDSIRNE
jgi:predicted small metal-binding protein